MGEEDSARLLRDLQRKIAEIERDIYGDPRTNQDSLFKRVRELRSDVEEFRRAYEQEKVERAQVSKLAERLDDLTLDVRVISVRLVSIAAGVGAVVVMAVGAAIIGVLRYLSGMGL